MYIFICNCSISVRDFTHTLSLFLSFPKATYSLFYQIIDHRIRSRAYEHASRICVESSRVCMYICCVVYVPRVFVNVSLDYT